MATQLFLRTAGAMLLGLAVTALAKAQAQVEAYVGEPFGVGRMTVLIQPSPDREPADDGYLLTERTGRALYSTLVDMPVRRLLRDLFNEGRPILQRPEEITVYFLFQGNAPLDLSFYTPESFQTTVTPRVNPQGHRALIDAWWREYTNHVKQLANSGEYPMLVESYLMPTLARRIGLRLPDSLFEDRDSQLDASLGLTLGTESLEAAMQRQAVLNVAPEPAAASLPLPEPLAPPAVAPPAPPEQAEIEIEPIAMHVPEESLYVRFGNFSNYLWLRELLAAWGGDLQNMIQVRGLNFQIQDRQETQLALRESALAGLLGPAVIADIAFVGFDTFIREGAAFGVLFQARNNFALGTNLLSQRQAALKNHPTATQETVQIAGRDVLFLHTPDNTVRSFYATDGDYHLVATSRELVRRFFEAGEGKGPLGGSANFIAARNQMPTAGDQSVFVYLSEPFFRQLVSPKYRIEMARRMQAGIDIQLLKLARLAARNEGLQARSIEELIAADLLPRGFAQRPDGSRPVEQGGEIIDSLRGAPRSFLPVADVEIDGVTPSERDEYERFAEFYVNEWRQMDPAMIGLTREPLDDQGLERLHITLHVTPYLRSHYGPLGAWLGEPTTRTVERLPGDLVFVNAVMGRTLNGGPVENPDYLMFGGLRGFRLPFAREGGKLRFALGPQPLQFVQGYLGAWPFSGILSLLVGNPNEAPLDPHGFAPILRGFAWQRQWGDFTAISLSREILAAVTPQLRVVEAAEPAQLRLQVVDPTEAGVADSLNALAFTRAREATVSNSRFMNRLSDQLHVPPAEAKTTAEELLEAQLVSALGGDYELVQFPSGLRVWKSTALANRNQFALTEVPPEYEFPLLIWFRGLNARLVMTDDVLSAHAVLDLQGQAPGEPGFQLPSLPGFGGGDAEE